MKSLKKSLVTFALITSLPFAFAAKSFAGLNDNLGVSCQIGSNYIDKYKNRTIGISYGGDIMQVQAEVTSGSCWAYVIVVESKNNKELVGKKILINISNINFLF